MKKYFRGLEYIESNPPPLGFLFEEGVRLGECTVARGVSVGAYTYMNSGLIRSNVTIGRFCSIGRNVTIGSGSHDINALSTSPVFTNNSNPPIIKWADAQKKLRCIIHSDVWIGDNVFISSGVEIGMGCIIGAGSVVTKSLAPYTIYAGVPAKFIRKRFDEKIISTLINLKWDTFDYEKLKNLDIGNLSACIQMMCEWPPEYRTNINKRYIKFE